MGAQAKQVHDDLLDQIMSRQLMPGDRIDENLLRSRLSVSSTPVREALIALEATKVVKRRPRDGARVAQLDMEDVAKLTEALSEAEGAIAALAARRINKSQAKSLGAAARACTDCANSGTPAQTYYDLNLVFHQTLLSAANNEHLSDLVMSLANRLIAYLAARHTLPGEAQRSAREHHAICDAILGGDGDGARTLMIRHVGFSTVSAIDVMNALPTRAVSDRTETA